MVLLPEGAQDGPPFVIGKHSGEGRVLAELDRQRRLRRERLQDSLWSAAKDCLPGIEPSRTHAGWMSLAKPSKIRPSARQGALRVVGKVARDRPMEPHRLTLVTIQTSVRSDTARKGFDLAASKASLLRATLARQQPLVA